MKRFLLQQLPYNDTDNALRKHVRCDICGESPSIFMPDELRRKVVIRRSDIDPETVDKGAITLDVFAQRISSGFGHMGFLWIPETPENSAAIELLEQFEARNHLDPKAEEFQWRGHDTYVYVSGHFQRTLTALGSAK